MYMKGLSENQAQLTRIWKPKDLLHTQEQTRLCKDASSL